MIKKQKAIIFILVIIIIAFFSQIVKLNLKLTDENNIDLTTTSTMNNAETEQNTPIEEENVLSYDKYCDIFDLLASDLKPDGYVFTDGTIDPFLTLVDKDLTFNRRTVLNLSDELNTAVSDSTQKLLIFENKEFDRQINIIFSYIPTYLESDMINCFSPSDFENTTKTLSNKLCITTINYNNIIIIITQTSSKKIELQDNFTFIREIQKLII